MNELLNYLNNYAKNRKNKHRFSAVMVCLAVIVSFTVSIGLIEPAESASGELICGMEEHEHTQKCFELICGFDEETEEEIAAATTESDSEETTEATTSTEEATIADTEPATTDTETTETIISTCTDESAPVSVHVHNDECYRLICLTEAHLHKQDCYNQPVETEPATTETSTSASTSTSTDTTTSTEQTTETTTTTTELSEEVYELNAALFGELYMDRVSVLEDETEETGYKFYYTGGEVNQLYAHSYFGYHSTAIGEPTSNIVRTYNGNTYNYAYNFNGANSGRYVSINAKANGILILLFGEGDDFKVKVLNETTNQSTEKEFKTGYDGVMVVHVAQGVNYKVTQSGGTTKARLVYAEFVPAVTPKNDRIYRIRDAKTGLYLGVTEKNGSLLVSGAPIKTGKYNTGDRESYFKFVSSDNGTFQMYPQLDYSGVATQMVDCNNEGNIQTYDVRSDDENNRKHSFIPNDDGTFKIISIAKNDTTYYWKVENEQVKGDINADNSASFILEEEIIDTSQTYLIKNVRSGYYLHREEVLKLKDSNDSDKDNNKNEEIEISDIKTQIIQKNEVGSDSQFKFIPTGSYNEFYIVSADESYAFTTENVSAGTLLKYSEFKSADNQKFHVELLDDGTYRIYQIDETGKKFYIEISDTALNDYDDINDIRDINENAVADIAEFNNAKRHQQFYLFPVTNTAGVPDENRRVEARVIFGDYNDGKITINSEGEDADTRIRYDAPLYVPTFNLMYGSGDNVDKPYQKVDGELVIDRTKARKDWCYQYNYVWDLGQNTNEYYIKLDGVTKGNNAPDTISFGDKTFNVYYLVDTYFGHPGNYPDSVNAPTGTYPTVAPKSNDDQIVYIFLDLVDGNTNDFNLSFKKRWDGYNENGYKNRPLEKIRIQLQRLNSSGKWVEYNSENFPDDNYDFSCYFEVVDANGENKMYVHKAAVGNATDIYRVLNNDGTVSHYEVRNGETVTSYDKEYFDYETLSSKGWLTSDGDYRFNLHLEQREWNNVVLTVDGNNNPTHFTNGYYFNWKAIPYGNYRVVETQSFYDANDNNVFDAGDRDTSQEYYYMSYPPMRDSRGVLHIQNFTKDMVIEVQKKWQDDKGGDMTLKKPIEFEIWKCEYDPENNVPDESQMTKIKDSNGIEVFTTNENGYAFITSRAYDDDFDKNPEGNGYYYGVPDMKTKNGDTKYYYLIKEIVPDGYKLINGNEKGYVWRAGINEDSNPKDYAVDYEDGDGRKFIITNKAKIGLKVKKEWYNNSVSEENKIDYYNNNTDNPIYPTFKIYKGDRPGTPVVNGDTCSVNDVELEKIAEATIGTDSYFELVSDEKDKHGDSSYVNDKLNMLSDMKYELDSNGFDGTIFRNASDHPANIQGDYIVVDKSKRFWVGSNKTKNNQVKAPYITGTLKLEFENYDENSILSVGNRCNINGVDYDESKYYNINDANGVVSIPGLYVDGNYRIMGYNCTLNIKKVTFTHDAYYYIQEITDDNSNYTLSNGNDNGFVKIGDNFYTTITANSHYPVVTAQNIPKVKLDITKKWTPENADISKVMNFEIYKAFANGEPVVDGEGYKVTVNNVDYRLTKIDGTYQTNSSGVLVVENLTAFEKSGDEYKKLYYYIREVEGNYITSNSTNGFIKDRSGKYGTAYNDTSSNSGEYNFINTPKLKITVNKTWEYVNNGGSSSDTSISFKLYRTIKSNFEEYKKIELDGGEYVVGDGVFRTINNTITIENLPAYDENGVAYHYYIEEDKSTLHSSYNTTYNEKADFTDVVITWDKDVDDPKIEIVNKEIPISYELPVTGGSGTHGYTVAGGTIVLLSAAVLLLKRRKKKV